MPLELPVLPAEETLETAATAAQVYDASWLSNIQVITPQHGIGTVYVEAKPMSATTGAIHPSISWEVRTDKLWEAAEEVPEVAQAMGAILAAFGPLKAWLAAQEQPET